MLSQHNALSGYLTLLQLIRRLLGVRATTRLHELFWKMS